MPTMNNATTQPFLPAPASVLAFQNALRAWFLREHREMPWRRERSVYRTVVSEFMLQQTQVDTVRPYFENWVAKWKDFESLAAADEADVLRAWEGLGYYSRARNLHALARGIVAQGSVPETVAGWLAFRGIGAYTAAAIASIAQGVPAAVVDGNVVRILARLSADTTRFKDNGAGVKHFTPLAERVLNTAHPGDHNEAMMELGATICTKHNPRCLLCPVAEFCLAKTRSDVAEIPYFAARASKKVEINRAFVAWKDGAVLLARAPSKARRLRELFELPRWEDLFPKKQPDTEKLLLEGRRGIASESILERIYAGSPPKNLEAKNADSGTEFIRVPAERLEQITLSGPHRKWLRQILKAIGD